MSSKKKKFYVVLNGFRPGIYETWEECQRQITGFPAARYKSFPNLEEAKYALENGWETAEKSSSLSKSAGLFKNGGPIIDSISVDAAWNTRTLDMEYQGVYTADRSLIFRQGPFANGTNNVGEFLAIVHALAFCKNNGLTLPIYSDSRNAINWVRMRHHKSLLVPDEKNKPIFNLLSRAETWLKTNRYDNKVLKWETREWGENPADFGRK